MSGETLHVPSRVGPFRFGMPDLIDNFHSYVIDPVIDLGVVPRGTTIPFHIDIFGSDHIAPFAPLMGCFSFPSFGHNTNVQFHGGDPRHVNVGGKAYIPSYAPSSTAPFSSNSFLMTHPPHDVHSPSRQSDASSHVFPSSFGTIVSRG